MARLVVTATSRSGTTITRNILSLHKDIWLTNEGRLYWEAARSDYYQFLYSKLIRNTKHHKPPGDLEQLKKLKMGSIKERVEAAEEVIFDNRCRHFGDKGITKEASKLLMDNNLPFKIVVLHRDGRDVISSSLYHPWARNLFGTGSIKDKSLVWTQTLKSKFEIIEEYGVEGIVLRFEDYAEFPGKNMGKVEKFLNVSGLQDIEKDKFKIGRSHIGYYKKHCPNWREEFHPEAIELLKKLEYI